MLGQVFDCTFVNFTLLFRIQVVRIEVQADDWAAILSRIATRVCSRRSLGRSGGQRRSCEVGTTKAWYKTLIAVETVGKLWHRVHLNDVLVKALEDLLRFKSYNLNQLKVFSLLRNFIAALRLLLLSIGAIFTEALE